MNDGWGSDERIGVEAQQWLAPMLSSATASIVTGIALVATRYVVQQADGLTVATLRYSVAAACLLPVARALYRFNVAKRDFFVIAAFGILYFCIFPWCISAAMQLTTASGGAIVLACTPAITLILAVLWGSEAWSLRRGFGVVLAILGATIAVGGTTVAALGETSLAGDALMILATFCGAAYAVFSKPYLAKYPPVVVTAIAMGTGAATLLVLWMIWDLPKGLPDFNATGWLLILFIGAAGGACSFFLYAWALGRTTPTATMILLPLNPVAAIFAGVVFLGEPLNLDLFVGLAFVIMGIFLVMDITGTRATPAVVPAKVKHEIPPA
jgi:drug/metabolite transporter (DMT)-like permease